MMSQIFHRRGLALSSQPSRAYEAAQEIEDGVLPCDALAYSRPGRQSDDPGLHPRNFARS